MARRRQHAEDFTVVPVSVDSMMSRLSLSLSLEIERLSWPLFILSGRYPETSEECVPLTCFTTPRGMELIPFRTGPYDVHILIVQNGNEEENQSSGRREYLVGSRDLRLFDLHVLE